MKRGRLAILLFVLAGAALSTIVLLYYSRGGGISRTNLISAIVAFLGVYLPLLGVMAGSAFGKKRRDKRDSGQSIEMPLVLAFVLVGAQAFSPGLLLVVLGDINSVLTMLQTAAPGSQPISLGAVAYFFSKE